VLLTKEERGDASSIAVAMAVRTRTFLWGCFAPPQKCPKKSGYSYKYNRLCLLENELLEELLDLVGNSAFIQINLRGRRLGLILTEAEI